MKKHILLTIFSLIFSIIIPVQARNNAFGDKANDLPVIITSPKPGTSGTAMVLYLSGDGGWNTFSRNLADAYAQTGIPVIALDSKKYFWKEKSIEETCRDVSGLIEKHNAIWKRSDIILVGYSFGAGIVPFIYNRLPAPIKSKVKVLALLSPATQTDFEVHLSDMLSIGNAKKKYDVTEELRKIKSLTPVCIFGKEEEDVSFSAFKDISRVKILEGGHRYNLPPDLLIKEIHNKN